MPQSVKIFKTNGVRDSHQIYLGFNIFPSHLVDSIDNTSHRSRYASNSSLSLSKQFESVGRYVGKCCKSTGRLYSPIASFLHFVWPCAQFSVDEMFSTFFTASWHRWHPSPSIRTELIRTKWTPFTVTNTVSSVLLKTFSKRLISRGEVLESNLLTQS